MPTLVSMGKQEKAESRTRQGLAIQPPKEAPARQPKPMQKENKMKGSPDAVSPGYSSRGAADKLMLSAPAKLSFLLSALAVSLSRG